MINIASGMIILSDLENGLRFLVEPSEIIESYPHLAKNVEAIKSSLEQGGPFPEGGLVLNDLIESADENASFEAQKFRNDLADTFAAIASKGLHLRTIDEGLTTAAQRKSDFPDGTTCRFY